MIAIQKIKDLHERRREGKSRYPKIFDSNPDRCNHLKGGSTRQMSGYKDYAISAHRFLDNHVEVRCTICGKKWTKDSPDWANAFEMMQQSSNSPSSSEVSLKG